MAASKRPRKDALGRKLKEVVQVETETVAFVRVLHSAGLLLIQAGDDQTQAEEALMMVIEACNGELERRGFTDKSHTQLPVIDDEQEEPA